MKAMKSVVCVVATGVAVACAVPALARDRNGGGWRGHWHQDDVVHYYAPVHRHFHARRPVYVVRPAPVNYPAPAPVVYRNAGAIGGEVVGAVIGSQLGRGDARIATTAIGAVLGGVIGGQLYCCPPRRTTYGS